MQRLRGSWAWFLGIALLGLTGCGEEAPQPWKAALRNKTYVPLRDAEPKTPEKTPVEPESPGTPKSEDLVPPPPKGIGRSPKAGTKQEAPATKPAAEPAKVSPKTTPGEFPESATPPSVKPVDDSRKVPPKISDAGKAKKDGSP